MAAEKLFCPAMASLPLDIIVNHIFIRLPVRSLLRCRCVCKQWRQLQTEHYFITMHLKHQNFHNHQKILCGPVWYKEGLPGDSEEDYLAKWSAFNGVFYSLHLQQSSSTADAVRLPGLPFHLKNYRFIQLLGYCNGMVCMEVHDYSEKVYSKSKRILIGNPSTGDYKVLPEPTSFPLFIGFGCDSSIDDYKCVWVDNVTRNPRIFSLKSNSWRTNLGSSDNYAIKRGWIDSRNAGFALDRSIYWLVDSSDMIVEFDFKDEEFGQLPLPSDRPRNMPNSQLYMKVFAGSLCIVSQYLILENNVETNVFDVWLMLKQEENDKKEDEKCRRCCWSKLMTVKLSAAEFGISGIHPLSFMKDGKILCSIGWVEDKLFVLIDPKTKMVEDFTVRDEIGGDRLEQFTFGTPRMGYIDTLVSPN